jgi:hypothetical protein
MASALVLCGGPGSGEPGNCCSIQEVRRWERDLAIARGDLDGAALLGLEQTIARDHPPIVFEWEDDLAQPHGISLEDTIHILQRLGYTVHAWPTHTNNFYATRQGE